MVTHPLAIAALATAFGRRHRALSLGLGAASVATAMAGLLLGALGYFLGMSLVESAVANADVESREMLMEVGRREAMVNVWCALASAAIPGLFGALALARGATLPKPGAPGRDAASA